MDCTVRDGEIFSPVLRKAVFARAFCGYERKRRLRRCKSAIIARQLNFTRGAFLYWCVYLTPKRSRRHYIVADFAQIYLVLRQFSTCD